MIDIPGPNVIATTAHLENSAHAQKPELLAMLFDKRVLLSETLAKYAAAFFRMQRSLVVRLRCALSLVISACRALTSFIGVTSDPLKFASPAIKVADRHPQATGYFNS